MVLPPIDPDAVVYYCLPRGATQLSPHLWVALSRKCAKLTLKDEFVLQKVGGRWWARRAAW